MSWEDVDAGWGRHAAAFAYLIENLHWREYQHLLDQTGVASGTRYLDSIGIFIFCAGSVSSYRNGGRGCPVHTGEEWTVRRRRGTTTVPSQSSPPHSVDADAGSTRTGLECLSANLCRSLGGVSAYPSALSDAL